MEISVVHKLAVMRNTKPDGQTSLAGWRDAAFGFSFVLDVALQ